MSEDWLRRRLEGLAGEGPPPPAGRATAALGLARRRTRNRVAATAVAAAAVLVGATGVVLGEGGGEQSLVVASPSTTSSPATAEQPTPAPTAEPAASSSASGAAPPGEPSASGSASPPAAPPPPAPGDTSVLRLGFVGDVGAGPSSAAGDGAATSRLLQAWVADVNAAGGLGGRRVELLVRDDGSDQGRRRAAVVELIEAGVVAFVGNEVGSAAGDASTDALREAGVALVGGDLRSPVWRSNPLLFAQGALPYEQGEGMLAVLGERLTDDDRDAAVVCASGAACRDLAERVDAGRAEAYGLRGTSVTELGVTETNYGPVVQRLKASGTDLVALQLAWQQAVSLAKEFARQGYRPKAVVVQQDLAEQLAEQPETQGWWAVQPVFAHVATGSATERYRRVAPTSGSVEARAWTAAMLLERAVEGLGGARATRAALLSALRDLRDERLGGLAPTLDPGALPASRCVLVARVTERRWTAPLGLRETCLAD